MRDKLYIYDNSFEHSCSSSHYNQPENFDWVRKNFELSDYIVITNLFDVDKFTNKKVYGWLIEPYGLISNQYEFAKNNFKKFHRIFTYDKSLIEISDVFVKLPIGGCWIESENRKIYEKSKLVCTIASNKKNLFGHKLRHDIINQISNIDVYGFGYNPVEKKVDILKNYMFNIVVENEKTDFLFTEKILDSFQTGTIPIYYGCPSIGDFFDINGIITFTNILELKEIINNLNVEFYNSKLVPIKNNFELSKKYLVADNLIYKYIKNHGNQN